MDRRTFLCACGQGVDRRRLMSGLACVAASGLAPQRARAEALVSARQAEDEGFMRLALKEAEKGDFPFGAVIVDKGEVVARGRNSGVRLNDPTAHGEMVALHDFTSRRPAAGLKGTTLYTTGEPCPMCMGAILWSGIGRLVYGASIAELSTRIGQIMTTSEALARAAPFASIEITGGVLSHESLDLFK